MKRLLYWIQSLCDIAVDLLYVAAMLAMAFGLVFVMVLLSKLFVERIVTIHNHINSFF